MATSKKPSGDRRDLTITKTCVECGSDYHPRKNGYEMISKYCSAACARKASGRFRVVPGKRQPWQEKDAA